MVNALISFLRLYHDVSDDDAKLISSAADTRTYKEGDYLFSGDAICREIFFIIDGVLRIITINEQGDDVTHYFIKCNQFCTIMNSFTYNVKADEKICAACDAHVMAFSKTRLEQLYQQVPYLKTLIDEITRQALLDKITLRNAYLGLNSTDRYKTFITRQPEIALRVSLSDVASYLGITPQSLSRIRRNIQ